MPPSISVIVILTQCLKDATTSGNCLGSKSQFKKASTWTTTPTQCHPQRQRWFASAGVSRWLITTILCTTTLGVAIGLLVLGSTGLNAQAGGAFTLGFGAINTNAVLTDNLSMNVSNNLSVGIVANVLIANSPQLLLSFLYFAYNGLWTCMLLTLEWSEFAKARKPLRVTSPTGGQRSTYRLQLPYRYGIPLLIISGLLHWLVSQSIFLVVIEAYTDDGTLDPSGSDSMTTCGYSPIALLTTIIIGAIVLAVGIANGFRRYKKTGIPLAGSCSAAISAACHPPLGDDRASKKAVMWGVCGSDVDGDWDTTMDSGNVPIIGKEAIRQEGGKVKVGHCSFTSFAVEEPVEGELYAGLPSSLTKQ